MRLFIGGRRNGKTRSFLEYLEQNPTCMGIVFSEAEAQRLLKLRPHLEGRIIPVSKTDKLRGQTGLDIAIDNLDLVLPVLVGRHVSFVTATQEESYGH